MPTVQNQKMRVNKHLLDPIKSSLEARGSQDRHMDPKTWTRVFRATLMYPGDTQEKLYGRRSRFEYL